MFQNLRLMYVEMLPAGQKPGHLADELTAGCSVAKVVAKVFLPHMLFALSCLIMHI